MTSYTKQLRAGKGTIAALSRENLDPATVPAETEMTPEAAAAVLAEPVAQEIEQDVLAPAEQIEQGTDALMEAEADAGLLENTAQILEDASGETATDVDVATPELANITVERISAKYGMARTAVLSKESLGAAAGRVETTRFISKEAFEKAGELRKRVSEGVAKLIEWFKNLIKNIFDKRTKLEKRFQAIQAAAKAKSAEGLEVAPEGKTIKIGGIGFIKGGEVVDNIMNLAEAADLNKLIDGLKTVGEFAKDNTASNAGQSTGEAHDFNPSLFGGVSLKASLDNGKLVVTKEQSGAAEAKEIKPMPVGWVMNASKSGLQVLTYLKVAEAELNKVVAEMGTAVQKLKALVTGQEDGAAAARTNILARYQGVSKISGAISVIALTTLASVATACEQSLSTYEKPAA